MKRTYHPKPDSVIEWESRHVCCFLCGADAKHSRGGAGLATHHIQRRSTSFRPYRDNPENLMRLCWLECHDEVEHWPAARQLALKWQQDKCGYDWHESHSYFDQVATEVLAGGIYVDAVD